MKKMKKYLIHGWFNNQEFGQTDDLQEALRILKKAEGDSQIHLRENPNQIDQAVVMVKSKHFYWDEEKRDYKYYYKYYIQGENALRAWGIDLTNVDRYDTEDTYYVTVESNFGCTKTPYNSLSEAIRTAKSWSFGSVSTRHYTLVSFCKGTPSISQNAFDFWGIEI